MAQTVRIKPLPGTGNEGRDSPDWMHELTPTLSDEAMFDDAGHVQPLQVWPNETEREPSHPKLRLVRKDDSPEDNK
jgi:hypothetical protein